VAGILAVAGFVILYLPSSVVCAFLAFAGLLWLALAYYICARDAIIKKTPRDLLFLFLLVVPALVAIVVLTTRNAEVDLNWEKITHAVTTFGVLQVAGIAGLAFRGYAELTRIYQSTRKKCPDCAEMVLAEAHVCKHCGYRWSSR
jgi:uncharacterized protein involved in response to NO